MLYANNKGADQPAHPRSLISAFVVLCLDSIIPLLAIADLSLTWSEIPEGMFSRDVAQINYALAHQSAEQDDKETAYPISSTQVQIPFYLPFVLFDIHEIFIFFFFFLSNCCDY